MEDKEAVGIKAVNKEWKDLNDSERIERMREIVKRQGRQVEELFSKFCELRRHKHLGNEIVVPLNGYGEGVEGDGSSKKVYF